MPHDPAGFVEGVPPLRGRIGGKAGPGQVHPPAVLAAGVVFAFGGRHPQRACVGDDQRPAAWRSHTMTAVSPRPTPN